jgi:hypothetical protein
VKKHSPQHSFSCKNTGISMPASTPPKPAPLFNFTIAAPSLFQFNFTLDPTAATLHLDLLKDPKSTPLMDRDLTLAIPTTVKNGVEYGWVNVGSPVWELVKTRVVLPVAKYVAPAGKKE